MLYRRRITLAIVLVVITLAPARAQWEYVHFAGEDLTCVVADPVNKRIYEGCRYGFVYLDQTSGVWTDVLDLSAEDTVSEIVWFPDRSNQLAAIRHSAESGGYIGLVDLSGQMQYVVLDPPGTEGPSGLVRDPNNSSRLFATTSMYGSNEHGGSIRVSEDGGWTWRIIEQSAEYDRRRIAMEPSGDLYVVGEEGLLRSVDDGLTWIDAQGDLPSGEIYEIKVRPLSAPGHLYACTEQDLFETVDAGAHWEPILWEAKCFNVAVHPLNPEIIAAHITQGVGPPDFVPVTYDGGETWEYSGYMWVAGDWGSLSDLDISSVDNMIYVNSEESAVAFPLMPTSVVEPPAVTPALTAFPNPFNPATRVSFTLREPGPARVSIHDTRGRLLKVLVEGDLPAGANTVSWDGRDAAGAPLTSGVYLCRLEAAGIVAQSKLTLLK